MKLLKDKFTGIGEVKGVNFEQLEKNEKSFIYKLTENGNERYEVFERRIQKAATVQIANTTVTYEEAEIYPKSNSFGDWAWCYTNKEQALQKFSELSKKKNNSTHRIKHVKNDKCFLIRNTPE